VICFFALFGCAYEFVNCYNKKKSKEDNSQDEDDQQDESNVSNNIEINDNNNNNDGEEPKKDNKLTLTLLIIAGVLCQPFYLLFYLLYGLMECYRRFNCWFYYVDY
jgi:hypothetical protein